MFAFLRGLSGLYTEHTGNIYLHIYLLYLYMSHVLLSVTFIPGSSQQKYVV